MGDPARPEAWTRLCDLCRTEPDAPLNEHQRVCPDALAFALEPNSLGLREYWQITGDHWNRNVYRVLGVPLQDRAGAWYTHWSDGALRGPQVMLAKIPKGKGQEAAIIEWGGRVGSELFSTEAQAREAALWLVAQDVRLLHECADRLRAGVVGRRRYRKADEARVVHPVSAP